MPTDDITLAFRTWGRDDGFRRKGTTLFRDQDQTIAVVNLQKSQWGGRYYINVALWIKGASDVVDPPQHKCQIRTRLESLDPDRGALETALDLGSGLDGEARATAVRRSLELFASPPLRLAARLDDLKPDGDYFLQKCLVDGEAQAMLRAL